MLAVRVALCVALLFARSDAARPELADESQMLLHSHGQLSNANKDSGGPFQDQLRNLSSEFEDNHPAMIEDNKEKTQAALEHMQDYVNKSKLAHKTYQDLKRASETFHDRLWDQHLKLDTVMQRHFKWDGKPRWEGPLRGELDHLGSDALRDYVISKKDRRDIKDQHIIEYRPTPLLNMGVSGEDLEKELEGGPEDPEDEFDPDEDDGRVSQAGEPQLPFGVEWPLEPSSRQLAAEWYKEMIQIPLKQRKDKMKDADNKWNPLTRTKEDNEEDGATEQNANDVYEFLLNVEKPFLAGEDLKLKGGGVDPDFDGPGAQGKKGKKGGIPQLPAGLDWPTKPKPKQLAVEWYKGMTQILPVKKRKKVLEEEENKWMSEMQAGKEHAGDVYEFVLNAQYKLENGEDVKLAEQLKNNPGQANNDGEDDEDYEDEEEELDMK